MKLTIYAVESGPVVAVKAIREALRLLSPGEAVSLAAASATLSEFEAQGSAVLAEVASPHDSQALIDALRVNGVFATTGDPERAKRQRASERLSEAGATPEDVFSALAPGEAPEGAPEEEPDLTYTAATAMVLLVMTEGNPLNAAAHTFALSRATGDPEFWTGVQRDLVGTFPFLEGPLRDNGVLL